MTQRWWVLASVACGTFMATLDSSIVNIALPTLTKSLEADLSQVKWVVMIYLLVITCLLLPFGRLSDQKGRKKVFQWGYLIFTLGSSLCGFSPRLSWLVVFRGLQAIGASMLMANGPAIITSTFPPRERGAALGTLAMVVSVGLVTGPSIGGILIAHFGWRTIFWINIPIGFLGALLVNLFVKKDAKPVTTKTAFDWKGAALQTVIFILFISSFGSVRLLPQGPIGDSRGIIGIVLLGLCFLFFQIEKRAKAPLLDLGLLKNRTFLTANLAGFFAFVAFSSVTVLMPFFLEEVLKFAPQKAGLFMTAIPLTIFVVAPISGRISDRIGSQEISITGAIIGAISLFAMAGTFGAGVHEYSTSTAILFGLSTIGLAMGLFQSPNNNAIMSSVPHHRLGVASAVLATVRNLGLVTGTGLATTLLTWKLRNTGSFVYAFHSVLFTAGFVALAAVIASLGKRRGIPAGA